MDTTCYQEAQIAKSFITNIYDSWKDGKKDELQQYYNDNSKLSWNGLTYKGIDIMKLFMNIYQRFTITSIDCQPIDKEHLLINVTGIVIYDGDNKTAKLYSHQIVLESKNTNGAIGVCVVLENFRWLAPCNVRAEQEMADKPQQKQHTPRRQNTPQRGGYQKKNFYTPGRNPKFQNQE